LQAADCDEGRSLPKNAVDYDSVIPFKHKLLEKAWTNFRSLSHSALRPEYDQFCLDQAHWLDDYALFRALKTRHGGAYYLDWSSEFVRREPATLARARRDLAELIEQVRFAQFLLFRQGKRLREYSRAAGVRLIGDLPFFVSPDSSDVWANPNCFCWMNAIVRDSWPAFRPTISARKGNSGATPSIIGRRFSGPVTAGA
jgi:4-alpha-glucanotransferase